MAPAGRGVAPSPRFFSSPAAWRRWLERHHRKADALWVGYHKVATGRPSMTWSESVDQALCFGWIDGIRRRIDDERYMIRFTPRRPTSSWSAVNIAKMKTLLAADLVAPAGLAAWQQRRAERSGVYSYEQGPAGTFAPALLKTLKSNRKAWAWWQTQPPGYRRTATAWVVSAKREETRARRMATLVADAEAGLRIGPLRRPEGPAPRRHR